MKKKTNLEYIKELKANRTADDAKVETLLNNFAGVVNKYVSRKITLEEFETSRALMIEEIRKALKQ